MRPLLDTLFVTISVLCGTTPVATGQPCDPARLLHSGPQLFLGDSPYAAVPGDFTGDGRMDLAFTVAAFGSPGLGTVRLSVGLPGGGFAPPTTILQLPQPVEMITTDLDSDGALDLVIAERIDQHIVLLFGRGDGSFDPPVTLNTTLVLGLAAADFDHDGDLDLAALTLAGSSQSVMYYEATAPRQYIMVAEIPVPNPSRSLQVADLDGDGRTDAAVGAFNNILILRTLDDEFTISTIAVPVATTFNLGLAIGDVNGDGLLDLVASDGEDAAVLIADGMGGYNPGGPAQVDVAGFTPRLADLDGDNDLDLITANIFFSGPILSSVSYALNDGGGAFSPAERIPVAAGPEYVNVADLNGDARVDVVASSTGAGTAQVLYGQCAPVCLDLSGDRLINGVDLAFLIAGWGGPGNDLNGDGTTGPDDLALLLAAWGDCDEALLSR